MIMDLRSTVSRVKDRGLRFALRTTARVLHRIDRLEESAEEDAEDAPTPDKHRWRPINATLDVGGETAPIPLTPTVELERPMVMVPGYRAKADCFDSLANTLVKNGYNGGRWYLLEDGAVFDSTDLNQGLLTLPTDAKVFVTRFEGNVEPPDLAAQRLADYLDRVAVGTDHEKVDVTAYSMGGIISRSYLDQEQEPRVGKLMQLGTPNQGSELARLGAVYLEERPSEFGEQGLLEEKCMARRAKEAADWISPTEHGNPELNELNSRWEDQRGKLEDFRVVGSRCKPTLGPDLSLKWGDGVVHVDSLSLPGESPVVLENGLSHGQLCRSAEVFEQAQGFFGWQIANPSVQISEPAPEHRVHPDQMRLF